MPWAGLSCCGGESLAQLDHGVEVRRENVPPGPSDWVGRCEILVQERRGDVARRESTQEQVRWTALGFAGLSSRLKGCRRKAEVEIQCVACPFRTGRRDGWPGSWSRARFGGSGMQRQYRMSAAHAITATSELLTQAVNVMR